MSVPAYCESPESHESGCSGCSLSSYGRDCRNNPIERRSKADFRALRETIGMSQQFLAALTDVTVSTVKRWENPAYFDPPRDAWQVLDDFQGQQDNIVKAAVKKVFDLHGELPNEPELIMITYYRTQEQYDLLGRDQGDYGIANANSRAIAAALTRSGYVVQFEYPTE